MPLIFKLTAQPNNNIHIVKEIEETININYINNLFKEFGLDDEELSKIKFITDSTIISNIDQTFSIKTNEVILVHIFTVDFMIRHKLQDIFSKNGVELQSSNNQPQQDINKPLNIKPIDSIPVMTQQKIAEKNKKTLELFSDPNFVFLIKIVTEKPEYINMVANYFQKGTILPESMGPVKTMSELSEEELSIYKELSSVIKLDVSEEVKMNMLIKHNGHLDLTIRAILSGMIH